MAIAKTKKVKKVSENSNPFITCTVHETNKIDPKITLHWYQIQTESGNNVPLLMRDDVLIGVYRSGHITANKAFKAEFSKTKLEENWQTTWVSKEDMLVFLANQIVEISRKGTKDEKLYKERCLHFEAKVVNAESSKCPQCGIVQTPLVFGNLIEKLAQVNEAIWEQQHVKNADVEVEKEKKVGKKAEF